MVSRKKRVLITGGAGYIGSILARKLLICGYKVRVLDKLIFGIEPIQNLLDNQDFELVKADVLNAKITKEAVRGSDYVIHLAGVARGSINISENIKKNILNDYLSTKILVNIAKSCKVKRFIFASTCSVYGANDRAFLSETSTLNPLSLYARTKLQSENYILQAAGNRFTPVILRLATAYGLSPKMRFDLVLNLFVANALKEREIVIFGGSQWRPFIHCSDAADAFVTVIRASKKKVRAEIFNVGNTAENYQIIQVGEIIKELISGTKISFAQNNGGKSSYLVDFSKGASQIGLETKYCIKDGILEMKSALEGNK